MRRHPGLRRNNGEVFNGQRLHYTLQLASAVVYFSQFILVAYANYYDNYYVRHTFNISRKLILILTNQSDVAMPISETMCLKCLKEF